MSQGSSIRIEVSGEGAVTGALHEPTVSRAPSASAGTLVALAPGAGTTIENPRLIDIAAGLAARGMTVMRFNFLYAERGSRRPDPPKTCIAAYRAAADALRARAVCLDGAASGPKPQRATRAEAADSKLVIGGRSMGGRMASMLAAEGYACDGLVFFGYPLHPAGQPGKLRDAHLPRVKAPMLFVQGTRDALCDLDLLRPVLARVGPRATLHVVAGADHSFDVRKMDGRTPQSVLDEVIGAAADWIQKVVVA